MWLILLIVAVVGVWALVRLGRQTEGPRRGQWRVTATLIAAVMMAGGALATARGGFILGPALLIAALYLVLQSRDRPVRPSAEAMSAEEARSLLGVGPGASDAEVQSAWRRLMARAHPDQGGTEGLAARLNAARDRLLGR